MLMREACEQIVEYGKRVYESGLCVGTSGNLSVYDPAHGTMAISPSGIGYFETSPSDVVIMDLEGHVLEGTRRPSSEFALHSAFYLHRPDARAVVHTHSPYATTLAALREPIRAVHFAIMGSGVDEVPCVPYVTFGTQELADTVSAALDEHLDTRAVLMSNHGLICCQSGMAKAFALAVDLEFTAQIQWRAMCAGTPRLISHEEMASSFERLKSYGQ